MHTTCKATCRNDRRFISRRENLVPNGRLRRLECIKSIASKPLFRISSSRRIRTTSKLSMHVTIACVVTRLWTFGSVRPILLNFITFVMANIHSVKISLLHPFIRPSISCHRCKLALVSGQLQSSSAMRWSFHLRPPSARMESRMPV